MHQFRRRALVAPLAAVLALSIGAAGALAAHPKKSKKYSGTTSEPAYNGFNAAVTFTTSANGKRLLKFTYQSFGCFGSGGKPTPGINYFAMPGNTHKVGTIKVSKSGKFSVKNAKSKYSFLGTTVTTTTVSGKFTNSKTATGKITFRQKYTPVAGPGHQSCGPVSYTFTAKAS